MLLALSLIGAVGYGVGAIARDDGSDNSDATRSQRSRGAEASPSTPAPDTPGAAALSGLVVRQADLPSSSSVQLIPGGNQVADQVTLDLCNGSFPSESLRKARLQVAAVDAQGAVTLSTEAVLYADGGATAQAFAELSSVAASCPSTPVSSPVGGTPVTTVFGPAPDGAWPQTATVERRAFAFTTTLRSGQPNQNIAVYLRRGAVLLGLYFPDPGGTIPTIAGQSTLPGIVSAFSGRLAQLPESVVNR
jgi:hypothetical protein